MIRVAIVVPGFKLGGGVLSMGLFLHQTMQNSGKFKPEFVSLATSANDEYSVRALNPISWIKGVRTVKGIWRSFPYTHVGAYGAEFEVQRYQPRKILTQLLESYDLIQVVSGGPAIGFAVSHVNKPKCIFVATRVNEERKARLAKTIGIRKLWLSYMTEVASKLETKALMVMDHVFAESEYTRQLLASHVNETKLSLGFPGIDTNLFHPIKHYNAESYILSVGRFADPRKNIRLLLEAYRKVRANNESAPRLVLAGLEGPLPKDWQLAIDWGVADFIDVRTNVSTYELAELYRNASLFLLSSDEEGLGIVILEAMASGLPVISTHCGGPATAIIEGETGVLTPIGDADAMAQEITTLLNATDTRHRMSNAGRKRAVSTFSLTAAGAAYLAVYKELLS